MVVYLFSRIAHVQETKLEKERRELQEFQITETFSDDPEIQDLEYRPPLSCYSKEAYVTLIHSDHRDLLEAATILIHQIKETSVDFRDVVIMTTPEISTHSIETLSRMGYRVVPVSSIKQADSTCQDYDHGLAYYNTETSTTLAKIHVWSLIKYERVLYMDLNTLVVERLEQLFSQAVSARVPTASRLMFPSDWFNSQFMLLRPSLILHTKMLDSLESIGTPDCSDNSFLNLFFSDWKDGLFQYYTFPKSVYQDIAYVPEKYVHAITKLVEERPLSSLANAITKQQIEYNFMNSGSLMAFGYMDNCHQPWPRSKRHKIKAILQQLQTEITDNPRRYRTSKDCTEYNQNSESESSIEKESGVLMNKGEGMAGIELKGNENYAYVTFVQNDNEMFIEAALIMIATLKKKSTVAVNYPIVAMVTSVVSVETISRLKEGGYTIRQVATLAHPLWKCRNSKWDSKDGNSEIAKLRVWELVEYEKILYLDTDLIILDDISELFKRPGFSASHGIFPPFEFNAGVMVLEPSEQIFHSMIAKFAEYGTHDCGDQGFLNVYYSSWATQSAIHHIPNGFNSHIRLFTTHFWRTRKSFFDAMNVKIVHYSGLSKPWEHESLVIGDVDFVKLWKDLRQLSI